MNLPLFLTFMCIAVKSLQTDTTDFDSNELLTKLLELHQYHCGETATCGSSEHVEPSKFARIPGPCCIPCSCLQSCTEQQNCCPFAVNETLETPTTVLQLETSYQDNGINETNNGSIFVRNDIAGWDKSDENKTDQRTSIRFPIANGTEQNAVGPEVLKLKEMIKEKERCIRPQVMYKPNKYIDSPAYMMVVDCPREFEDKLIIGKCNDGTDDVGLFDMIPVTSEASGLTYKNKYCFMCNEKLQLDLIKEWTVEIISDTSMRALKFFPTPDLILDSIPRFSNIHFVPENDALTRRCESFDIIACNQTGLWDNYNKIIENLCLYGHQLPIISRIDNIPYTFGNIACFHCNTANDTRASRLSCGYYKLVEQLRHSETLNLRSVFPGRINGRPLMTAPYIELDVLRQLDAQQPLSYRRCSAGQLEILGTCRRITCPRDHYAIDNQCVPLYDKLKELDVHIQLQIQPSQQIPGAISGLFVNNLKTIVDELLTETVRLERRQVSLWYLPRSKENPTQYYMLDVFFFSPTSVIQYSDAVGQIKQFFLKMKTRAQLAVPVGSNIRLNIQFQHGMYLKRKKYEDSIIGQKLIPVMEKGWAFLNPGPSITVSEVNWCFRTMFDLNEVERFPFYITVNSTDISVARDQYDRQVDTFYVCINPFVETMRVEDVDDLNAIESDKTPTDTKTSMSEVKEVDYERGFILTVCIIGVIVLLAILYRARQPNVRQQFQESGISSQSQGSIELNVVSKPNTDD